MAERRIFFWALNCLQGLLLKEPLLCLSEVECVQGLYLWRNTSTDVNNELYRGYYKGNSEGKTNGIVAGWSLDLIYQYVH